MPRVRSWLSLIVDFTMAISFANTLNGKAEGELTEEKALRPLDNKYSLPKGKLFVVLSDRVRKVPITIGEGESARNAKVETFPVAVGVFEGNNLVNVEYFQCSWRKLTRNAAEALDLITHKPLNVNSQTYYVGCECSIGEFSIPEIKGGKDVKLFTPYRIVEDREEVVAVPLEFKPGKAGIGCKGKAKRVKLFTIQEVEHNDLLNRVRSEWDESVWTNTAF